MNVLNKSCCHGKPSTASNGCTHTIRRTSEVNQLVYQGDAFLLLGCISASWISDSGKESESSKAGERECPAVQMLPLGTAPSRPNESLRGPMSGTGGRCHGPGRRDSWQPRCCTEQEGTHEETEADCVILTGSSQIVNYKVRIVSTTSQHGL